MSRSADVVPPLVAALDDTDHEVRRYAACSLALLGPVATPAVQKLIERLDDSHVGYMAARALGAIGPSARQSIPHIIANMRCDSSLARMEYAQALGRFGSEARSAISILRVMARDSDERVAMSAGDALKRIDLQAAPPGR